MSRETEVFITQKQLDEAVKKIIPLRDEQAGDDTFSRNYTPEVVRNGLANWLYEQLVNMLTYPEDYILDKPSFDEAVESAADETEKKWAKASYVVLGLAPVPGYSPLAHYKNFITATFWPGVYAFKFEGQNYSIGLYEKVTGQGLRLHEATRELKRAALAAATSVTNLSQPAVAAAEQKQKEKEEEEGSEK